MPKVSQEAAEGVLQNAEGALQMPKVSQENAEGALQMPKVP